MWRLSTAALPAGVDLLLEAWGSFPSDSGGEDVATVKLNDVVET